MCGGPKQILSSFTGRKKRKPSNKTRDKYTRKRQEIILQTWLEGSLDNQGAFSDHNQNDDSGNDGMEI